MTSDLTSSELNSSPSVTVDVDASAEVSGSNYTGIFFSILKHCEIFSFHTMYVAAK